MGDLLDPVRGAAGELDVTPYDEEASYRSARLTVLFQGFDMDGGGTIGSEELFQLGMARRELGQKSTEWTREANQKMITNMNGLLPGNQLLPYMEIIPKIDHEYEWALAGWVRATRAPRRFLLAFMC